MPGALLRERGERWTICMRGTGGWVYIKRETLDFFS